jgi:hypothetical protein
MKRTVLVFCMLLGSIGLAGLTGVCARAGEPAAKPKGDAQAKPAAKAPADVPEPVIPERKLEFELSEEPYPVRVRAMSLADPQVRKLSHVAVIRLSVPHFSGTIQAFEAGASSSRPITLAIRPARISYVSPDQVVHYFESHSYRQSILDEIPKAKRPAEEVVSDLERALMDSDVEGSALTEEASALSQRTERLWIAISICAPSAERAEELAQGLLAMLDYGICYPTQGQWLSKKRSAEQDVAERRAKLAEEQSKLAHLEKELEKLDEFKDLNKEALSGLVTQQRLIAVDIAGAKAQIEACTRLLGDLARAKPSITSRIEQAESLKIAAEIELVGLTARKNAIDQIVQSGQRRASLAGETSQAGVRTRRCEREVTELERTVAIYEALRKSYEPFPLRGKITIHPIQWEVIEAAEKKK